ncbi:receptor-like protein 7 [Apium graveolens]|uniref:receptor-like protein 7 n=1 Tax=Apium graveolens TaxID=4045 RepID=UPI003D7A647F
MRKQEFSWVFLIPLFQILLISEITCVHGQCLQDQRQLLVQLKDGLQFDESVSTRIKKWTQSTEDCCKWDGVRCNVSSGYVIGLELDGEGISTGINSSSSLYKFKDLQRLNLANNNFNSTEIPLGLFNLLSLTYLNLSNCGFAGQIPEQFSRMTRLEILDLSTSFVSGKSSLIIENPSLKMIVQNLTELTELYLDGVNMTTQAKSWSQAISSSLPNLRILCLRNNRISGPIDTSLERVQFLSEIYLDQNILNDTVPEFLANFKNLTILRLSSCNLQGMFPRKILQIRTLNVLDLSNNDNLQGSLTELPKNGSLRTLVLSFTNFSGVLPESIGNLGSLSRMEITNCNFSGVIPNSMRNLASLIHLDFSYNNLSGNIPSLQKSKNLTYLDLSRNRLSGIIPFTYFKGLENLVHVDLGFNLFNGSIPSSLFALQSLRKIKLLQNQFSGSLADFSNASMSHLDTLDLSRNNLNGSISFSWFELKWLNILSLSFNQLSGSLSLDTIYKLENLTSLDLSYNNLSIETSHNSSGKTLLPQYSTFRLASCKLKSFPHLGSQSKLNVLDLSDNQIRGAIPNWTWTLGNGALMYLNFSRNLLSSFQEPYAIPKLSVLDLHSNQLTGKIPVPPLSASYVDYSANNFSSSMSSDIGKNLTFAYFFSVSRNKLTGNIPDSICKANYLQVLDLSNNNFSGVIPSCLLGQSKSLVVLNLGNNNFSGYIEGTFVENCSLKTLDLHANHLQGNVPESLSKCTMLEVLNLGSNQINDTFPCFLKNSSDLRVLVLRSNRFHGNIHCRGPQSHWPNLQIIDIASNDFTGKVPDNCFLNWTAMMGNKDNAQLEINHLRYEFLTLNNFYYQDTVTVTSKGLEVQLVKILTIFNSIDISCNQFEGNIPENVAKLKELYILNISHNALTGSIPPAIGNLKQLEALDFSANKLSGSIPAELANLNFLAYLNLSYNQLTGKIPVGNQLSTFDEESFRGNEGLCGKILNKTCPESQTEPSSAPNKHPQDSSSSSFDWKFIVTGIGFGVGAAIILGPLLFFQKGTQWLDENIDKLAQIIVQSFGIKCSRYEVVEEYQDTCNAVCSDEEDRTTEDTTYRGRYCLLCSKLDRFRDTVVHDPKCMCHTSTPANFSSSSSSSTSSSYKTP